MKRSKKPRVSWPPGPKLCQVEMFRTEECPAKVASQPQRHSYPKKQSFGKGKPRGPDLPPGFEGNHYAVKLNVSNIPRIKWKRPPKFIANDAWLVGDGGESTEKQTENLRIAKLLEAIYPHRAAIPSRPSVSPVVEAEHYDDSETPAIRLTPIEDELESTEESSQGTLESDVTSNKQDELETNPPCSTQELVSGLSPDLRLVASAALSALMKTKEQGSLVDPDLLIKFLSDPKLIKNLLTDTTGKSSETKNQPVETNINPTRIVPQHVTASPMTRKPQPIVTPQEQSFVPSQPFTNSEQRRVSPPKPVDGNISSPNPLNGNQFNIPMHVHSSVGIATKPKPEQRRVSPPKPANGNGNGNISSPNPLNGNPFNIPMPVHSSVGIATTPNPEQRRVSPPKPVNGNGKISLQNPLNGNPFSIPMPVHSAGGIATKPSLPVQLPSSSLPMNLNLQRPQLAFSEPKVIVKPQPQLQPNSAFRTSEMNNVQAPNGFGRGPQIGFDSYPMNLNRVDVTCRPKPVMQQQPTKSVDYFKNLIREHGTDNHETNQYHSQTGKFNGRVDQVKVQKQCRYFGTPRGCQLGDNCIYVHDRVRPRLQWLRD